MNKTIYCATCVKEKTLVFSLGAIHSLDIESRQRLYDYIVRQTGFHFDKLLDEDNFVYWNRRLFEERTNPNIQIILESTHLLE